MIDINQNPEDIIAKLSPTERNMLYILGKMHISVKKNFDEDTLKKKLSNKDLRNYKKSFSNLKNSGLIVMYRPGNYGISKKGRIVADKIVDLKRKNIYQNLKILLIFDRE